MRIHFIVIALIGLYSYSCSNPGQNRSKLNIESFIALDQLVKAEDFDKSIDGKQVGLFTFSNDNGVVVKITNYGARIVSVLLPDREGNYEDIVLGYSTIDDYLNDYTAQGAAVGRYANRIAHGSFSIDGVRYSITKNAGPHTLHGGYVGFGQIVWDAHFCDSALILTHVSPHLHEGFPGELNCTITYSLTQENELRIEYKATTDRKTHVNFSNHAYFNLKGEGEGEIMGHTLTINADYITDADSTLIPTGDFLAVEGTPFDFRTPHTIGERINDDHYMLKFGHGYDHNFVIKNDDNGLAFAARLSDEESGRTLEVYTTQPGMQIYTTNFMDLAIKGKKGKPFGVRGAVCLETQHFPDSPNWPNFPSTLLVTGQEYKEMCVYKFLVQK